MNVLIISSFVVTQIVTTACSTLVQAPLKGTATIPCNFSQNVTVTHPLETYWQKQVSPTEVLLVTSDGQEVPEYQTKKYVNRTSQDPNYLVLYLAQVTVADEGTYECIVTHKPEGWRKRIPTYDVLVKVFANFSFPELTQKPEGKVKNGTTVTLTCFSSEGYPAPQNVIWIVSSRNGITEFKGDLQKTQDNSTKLYNLTGIYTLNFTTNFNVSCTIHQTEPGGSVSSRTVSLDLEEDGVESDTPWGLFIGIPIGVCAFVVAAAAIVFAVCRKRHSCCRVI